MRVKRHKHRRLSRLELTLSPMQRLYAGKTIGIKIKDDREYTLHATKGYRSCRVRT